MVAAVTLLGAAFRFWGVFHGFREGYLYHPDAYFVVHSGWHHLLGAPWREGLFGPVYGALLWSVLRAIDALGRFAGYPLEWSFEGIAAAASLMGATLGTATIPLIYVLGRRAFDPATGVLAAALLAVAPLHAFQSHYPYRDVPMTFLLALSLIACVPLAGRAGVWRLLVAAAAVVATAAAKPAGLVAAAPLAVAIGIGLARIPRGRLWRLGAVLAIAGASGALLPVLGPRTITALRGFARSAGRTAAPALVGRHLHDLASWVGVPFLLASGLALAYALWRRRAADVLLLAFLVPALATALLYFSADERFYVFLLPAASVLVARGVVDLWRWRGPGGVARLGAATAAAGLLVTGAGCSAWIGTLLALPDTRAIAGGWFAAHVPRETVVAMEEYYPLGLNEWPHARSLSTARPLAGELAGAALVVTSSVEHARYFDDPQRFRRQVAFLTALDREATLVKTVALAPLGFLHPTLRVYATHPAGGPPPRRLVLPRPYDASWDRGVAALDPGPYDRDDRTIRLGGAQRYRTVLASAEPVDEVLAIVVNGPEPTRLRLTVGWTRRERALAPGAWEAIRVRPRWRLPFRPALYPVEVTLRPEGGWALVQLRSGPREIGEALAGWARWDAALPYLERAAAARPDDLETGLLLATAYRHRGRPEAAQGVIARLAGGRNAAALAAYRRLGDGTLRGAAWDAAFAAATGLDPAWLGQALAQDLEAEHLVLRTGRPQADAGASGDRSLVFERRGDAPGVLANGPVVFHQPAGAYRARFRLRAWDAAGNRPLAVLRVYAESRPLAERAVVPGEVVAGGYVEIEVPYRHVTPQDRVAFRVEATGAGSLALDRIRIVPDLPALMAAQMAAAGVGGS